MAQYKAPKMDGGPINMHKALAMGLNPETGSSAKMPSKPVAKVAKKATKGK